MHESIQRTVAVVALFAVLLTIFPLNPANISAQSSTSFEFVGQIPASESEGIFRTPVGIETDEADNVYVTELLNVGDHNVGVLQFDAAGNFVQKIGESGTGLGQFMNPIDIAISPNTEEVFVLDSQEHHIQVFNKATGEFQRKITGGFLSPSGMDFGLDGLYLADTLNNKIKVLNPATGDVIREWTTMSNGIEFYPSGLDIDPDGYVYVTRNGGNKVQKYDNSGSLLAEWTVQHPAFSRNVVLRDIAVDAEGNVFVTDSYNQAIIKLDTNGDIMEFWTGNGLGEHGDFLNPMGLTIGSNGHLYVVDANKHRVQIFRPTDQVGVPPGLTSLNVSGGVLSPSFNTNTKEYTITIIDGRDLLEIIPGTGDAGTEVWFDEQQVQRGEPILIVPPPAGTTLMLTVISSRGTVTVEEYTFTFLREHAEPPELTDLLSLSVTPGTLSPAFHKDITAYTVNVGHTVEEVTLTATVHVPEIEDPVPVPIPVLALEQDKTVTEEVYALKEEQTVTKNEDVPEQEITVIDAVDASEEALVFTEYVLPVILNPNENEAVVPTLTVTGAVYGTYESGQPIIVPLKTGSNEVALTVTAEGQSKAYTVDIRRAAAPPPATGGSGGGGGGSYVPKKSSGVKLEDVLIFTNEEDITHVTINHPRLKEYLQQEGKLDLFPVVSKYDTRVLDFTMTEADIKELRANNPSLPIPIQTPNGSYDLPLGEVDLPTIKQKAGLQRTDEIKFRVVIERMQDSQQEVIKADLAVQGFTPAADIVRFEVQVVAKDKTIAIESFSSKYINRIIPLLNQQIDPNYTTGVYIDSATNTPYFVPTWFEQKDGLWMAHLKRLGNSYYTIIKHSRTFDDITSHWAKEDIEVLASKLLVFGTGKDNFEPEANLTRAQYAVLLSRALGLQLISDNTGKLFIDVPADAWYEQDVAAVTKAGIMQGNAGDYFRPEQIITRQELAVVLAKAAEFVGAWDGKLIDSDELEAFVDQQYVPSWARDSISYVVETGIVKGTTTETGLSLNPNGKVTRAEAVSTLRRWLQKVRFMN